MTETLPETSIQDWFSCYADDLLGFLRRKVGDFNAPDLVQDIFLRILSYSSASIREPRAFLFRVAANIVVDHLRKESHRDHEDIAGVSEELVDPAPTPEATAIGTECMERFLAALAELSPVCRHAFVLNRFDGMTHSEIAELFGISPKTVQRHIKKALDHCLRAWEITHR